MNNIKAFVYMNSFLFIIYNELYISPSFQIISLKSLILLDIPAHMNFCEKRKKSIDISTNNYEYKTHALHGKCLISRDSHELNREPNIT